MEYYRLTEEQLTELLEAKNKLTALEAAGVDNWEGYEDAMENVEDVDISEYLNDEDIDTTDDEWEE